MSTVFEASYTELKTLEAEIERLRAALEQIERLGWKEGLGAEHAIASHYEIRKIVRAVLEQSKRP